MAQTNRFSKILFLSSCALCALTIASPAKAQTTNPQLSDQTGSADPGRIGEQLRPKMNLQESGTAIDVRPSAALGAPEGAENIRFMFKGLNIEGNNIYGDDVLSSIYGANIGREISLADVYSMANALSNKYRNDGYILTQVVIPPQTIDSGTPTIRVVEGYIDIVTVQADGEFEREANLIRAYAARISKGASAVNIKELERQLLLINDLPGVSARSVISPSETVAGAADMLIIIERDPFDALLSADNFGSRFLGQWNLNAVANINSALGMNELISIQTVYAPGSGYELLYGGLGYEKPIGTLGTRLGALVSVTDTDPGFSLRQFDVRGNSKLYSAYVSHPFMRSRNESLTGKLSFDWRDVKSSNNVEQTRRDNIRALRAEARFEFLDSLLGAAANNVTITVSQGLNVFGASEEGDANMSRNLGDPQFTKAEFEAQRLQRVLPSVNLKLSARGQVASDALPSSEEFGVGGFNSGRGYDPSEIVGDDGLSGAAELQWNNPVAINTPVLDSYQLYTFVDAGRVWNTDAATLDDKRSSLVSAGVGTRITFAHDIEMGAGVAFPLTRRVETENDRDPRYYLNISKKF